MPVIAISRLTGSGGATIGQQIADRLGQFAVPWIISYKNQYASASWLRQGEFIVCHSFQMDQRR